MTQYIYRTDKDGFIQDHGKFFGLKRYVPYLWELVCDGSADLSDHKEGIYRIDITNLDRSMYPELATVDCVCIHEHETSGELTVYETKLANAFSDEPTFTTTPVHKGLMGRTAETKVMKPLEETPPVMMTRAW